MTIDESEIRRLANDVADAVTHYDGEPRSYSYLSDRVADAIRTALAAEREQHARDVADAWMDAANIAQQERLEAKALGLGTQYTQGVVDCAGNLSTVFEARAQALNDSRSPSGINQGSGAGYAPACDHCGEQRARLPGGKGWYHFCYAAAPPPSPASPTGETRDEPAAGCFSHSDAAKCYPGCCGQGPGAPPFVSSAPASAPGGAPGVETRRPNPFCKCGGLRSVHFLQCGPRCCEHCAECEGFEEHAPSTETPSNSNEGSK